MVAVKISNQKMDERCEKKIVLIFPSGVLKKKNKSAHLLLKGVGLFPRFSRSLFARTLRSTARESDAHHYGTSDDLRGSSSAIVTRERELLHKLFLTDGTSAQFFSLLQVLRPLRFLLVTCSLLGQPKST